MAPAQAAVKPGASPAFTAAFLTILDIKISINENAANHNSILFFIRIAFHFRLHDPNGHVYSPPKAGGSCILTFA